MAHHHAPYKESVTVSGPAGALDALLELPERDVFPRVAVICHPHPLHHGSMLNKVVHTVSRAMLELGWPALRFNFRGVGASEGRFADGVGETADAEAACAWMRGRYPGSALVLAGFSFGAMVACRAALSVQPARLVTIAPPVERTKRLLDGRLPGVPWLIVQGDADGVVPAHEVAGWAEELGVAASLVMLSGVDHFFHGKLTLLRQTLVGQLREDCVPGALQ
jgi:hypothetical protein